MPPVIRWSKPCVEFAFSQDVDAWPIMANLCIMTTPLSHREVRALIGELR